ncbi:phosphoenolpyruvate--protein phosphotransferase [Saccharopolyspora sp. HNM0983]|uniref:Phosphoenolpyruvate-protein phosphotransferase n=1 Tax=Saccharopolyspora montiporae TaxID=2781240 RepID=A0A929BFA3_9PSEU|nr:putative PEP-binding protein [Saccharopolyspora sp. HNM0983]MBE9376503.1 phosphoenolpyruvate--protein phosphotransferase [Saccharopolyspora sp. HNM0983]
MTHPTPDAEPVPGSSTDTGATLRGVGVSPGRATGPVVRIDADAAPEPPSGPAPADPAAEAARIRPAAESVAADLHDRASAADGQLGEVLAMTATLATDPSLLDKAEALVDRRALPAARALFEAAGEFAELLEATGGYLAERVADLRDVRDRVIAELDGTGRRGIGPLTGPAVLLARDLAPADTAELDPEQVLALVTEEGGPTGHTAILARSLGIPAVVAARGLLAEQAASARVDGSSGAVQLLDDRVEPGVETVDRPQWTGAGRTADDRPVTLLANVGSAEDAAAAVRAGAHGSGLFRTEFCFLDAAREPDAEAQRVAYAAVLGEFAGKPVVVRTLDAGADKPLPFLDAGGEPNPALGVRGLRAAFERPQLLDAQLAAIAAAAGDADAEVSVMAPMVATAHEAAWFATRARAAGLRRAGVMVETPAAALCAEELLDAVDFVSIGTNDLAQYTTAADRLCGALAELNDPWQPALLRLVDGLCRAGRELGKPVGICGEAAADPLLAGVFTGMGATSLSMTSAALPAVGAGLAERTAQQWAATAQRARSAPDARTARARAAE